jgi:putative protease
MSKSKVGAIAHYFTKIGVAVIDLTGSLKVGDTISIQGATTSFEQVIDSMQIEHEMVDKAKAGDSIGLKVKDRVRKGDTVFKIG